MHYTNGVRIYRENMVGKYGSLDLIRKIMTNLDGNLIMHTWKENRYEML
jgi:hypothetical protein